MHSENHDIQFIVSLQKIKTGLNPGCARPGFMILLGLKQNIKENKGRSHE